MTKSLVISPTRILLVSQQTISWLNELDSEGYALEQVSDPGQAMETMRQASYDLLLMDDLVFEDNTASVICEIKRRLPLLPVFILSDNQEIGYQTDLIEAGIDDFLSLQTPQAELLRRLSLLLRQRRQNLSLAKRNQNLHAVTLLSRRLHSADTPHNLIIDTIDLVSSTFNLYGMVIALDEGDRVHLYAGSTGVHSQRRLYESTVNMHRYDPFRQSIESRIAQVYKDLNAHPYYTPIPVLPDARTAIITPLNYGDRVFGCICVFGTETNYLVHDDLVIYELFANHFASAYHNVRQYYAQDVNVQSNRHLLKAWQRLTSLYKFRDIAHTLRDLIQDMPSVNQSLVWLYDSDEQKQFTISAPNPEVAKTFRQLYKSGHVSRYIDQYDNRMQPMIFWLGRDAQDPLGPLFREMDGQQLIMVPILDSARLLGGVFTSIVNSQPLSNESINLIESLAHAAGQTLERNLLITATEEQAARLEAILRSIKEGIFFVADTNEVVFCNPQFTELTEIKPSEVLNHSPEALFELLAARSQNPEQDRQQLEAAMSKVLISSEENKDYPIVEFSLTNLPHDLYIEFVTIQSGQTDKVSWLGFLRTDKQQSNPAANSKRRELLNKLSDIIGVPLAHLYSSLITLSEQHGNFNNRDRTTFIHSIEQQVDKLLLLWSNFQQIYNLEFSGVVLEMEPCNPEEVVESLLESRAFSKYRRQINLEVQPPHAMINVDERLIHKALTNILENAIKYSGKDTPINILIRTHNGEVLISIQDQGIGIAADQLDHIFTPFYQGRQNADEDGAGLGLFISRELVQRHNGRIIVESRRGRSTNVTIALPAIGEQDSMSDSGRPVKPAQRKPSAVMIVEGRSRIVESFYDQIEEAGYELIICSTGEQALQEVNLIRLDVILIESDLVDQNGLALCEQLRAVTGTPIILISKSSSEEERINGLRSGADDYLMMPISEEEFLVRLDTISKRKQIAERTRPPLRMGKLYIDFNQREVFLENEPVDLTRIEYDLLQILAIHKGQVLTHKQLLEKVWGPEYRDETQYLWVNVSRLRKKLEPENEDVRYIHTQPGIGYIFKEA